MTVPITFTCPSCSASHTRGMIDGVSLFRCFGCGYQGYGHHADLDIDREIEAGRVAQNALHRQLGIAEIPPGIDPLDGGP